MLRFHLKCSVQLEEYETMAFFMCATWPSGSAKHFQVTEWKQVSVVYFFFYRALCLGGEMDLKGVITLIKTYFFKLSLKIIRKLYKSALEVSRVTTLWRNLMHLCCRCVCGEDAIQQPGKTYWQTTRRCTYCTASIWHSLYPTNRFPKAAGMHLTCVSTQHIYLSVRAR